MAGSKIAFLALLAAGVGVAQAAGPTTLPSLAERGRLTLVTIQRSFGMKGRDAGHYAEELKPADPKFQPRASFAWGVGIQYSALNSAAELLPKTYRPTMLRYAKAIDAYWFNDKNGLGGFNANIHPTSADRYYDDNAWLCLDFCDSYGLTGQKWLLEAAKKTWGFMLSGRDEQLGGGIYWHEQKKDSKNTCINAPAAVSGLRLYALTGDKTYLDAGRQLYEWTKTRLQDPADGLYFDNVTLDGKVSQPKYSYNTALMIRAACLLYDQTGDAAYLVEAGRLCRAGEAKWFRPDGSVDDSSYFGHLLVEAMLEYGQRAHDRHWADLAVRTCDWLWQYGRGPDGHFPERWNATKGKSVAHQKLMWDASNARLFFRVALATGEAAEQAVAPRARPSATAD